MLTVRPLPSALPSTMQANGYFFGVRDRGRPLSRATLGRALCNLGRDPAAEEALEAAVQCGPVAIEEAGALPFHRAGELAHRVERRFLVPPSCRPLATAPQQPAARKPARTSTAGSEPRQSLISVWSGPGRPGWRLASSAPLVRSSLARPVSDSEPSAPIVAVAATDWPTSSFVVSIVGGTAKRRSCAALADVVGGDQQLCPRRRRRPSTMPAKSLEVKGAPVGADLALPEDRAGLDRERGRLAGIGRAGRRCRFHGRSGHRRCGLARGSRGGSGFGRRGRRHLFDVDRDGGEGAERGQGRWRAGRVGVDVDQDRDAAVGDRVGGRRGVGIDEGDDAG